MSRTRLVGLSVSGVELLLQLDVEVKHKAHYRGLKRSVLLLGDGGRRSGRLRSSIGRQHRLGLNFSYIW